MRPEGYLGLHCQRKTKTDLDVTFSYSDETWRDRSVNKTKKKRMKSQRQLKWWGTDLFRSTVVQRRDRLMETAIRPVSYLITVAMDRSTCCPENRACTNISRIAQCICMTSEKIQKKLGDQVFENSDTMSILLFMRTSKAACNFN